MSDPLDKIMASLPDDVSGEDLINLVARIMFTYCDNSHMIRGLTTHALIVALANQEEYDSQKDTKYDA